MKKVILTVVIGVFLVSFANLGFSATTEIDALIRKLVEKGILTPKEAMSLKLQIAEDEKIFKKEAVKDELPSWIKNMKIKGDFRLRHQSEKKKGKVVRERYRIRFRLGLENKVNDEVEVTAGLTTARDPRSANQTLENSFESPEVRFDYAYAKYSPSNGGLTAKVGKIDKMPFWVPSDLVWDGDISPDGISLELNFKARPNLSPFLNTGIFVLDESDKDPSDPFMFAIQPGVDFKLTEMVNLKTALAYYDFGNVSGSSLDYSKKTNSLSKEKLVYDYNALGGSLEVGVKQPLESISYFAFLGEYVQNFDPSEDNQGFLLGCKLGAKKVKTQGQWQTKYLYRRLEKDAFLDTFPDSDFYGGSTNVKGHEVVFQYGLLKNVNVALDYYYSEPIKGTNKEKEHLLQLDVEFKF